jgi:hypothetical protein
MYTGLGRSPHGAALAVRAVAAAKSTNNAEQVVRALNRMVIVSSYLQWRAPCRRKRKPTMAVLGDSESMVR